jgi:hypothetical protein
MVQHVFFPAFFIHMHICKTKFKDSRKQKTSEYDISSATPSSSTPGFFAPVFFSSGFFAQPKSMSLTTNSLSPLRSVVVTNTLSPLMSFSERKESVGVITKTTQSPDARCRGCQDGRGLKAARAKPVSKYL